MSSDQRPQRLKLLFASAVFHPRTGGIERITEALAHGATERGHEVVVATQEPNPGGHEPFPFKVVRHPTGFELRRLARNSHAVILGGTSLRALWPIVASRRPIVIGHHNWYQIPGRKPTWAGWMKIRASHFASENIACSRAIAAQLPVPCKVIPSFYDDAIFFPEPGITRERDLVAVGRLVSDKGFDVLLDAMGVLAGRGQSLNLSIVGNGPEAEPLREQARQLGISGHVTFHGHQEGAELRRLLAAHRILIVPSRWPEPFGIVVGEGLACGCVVIGSDRGGLPEAIGPAGVTFRSEDPHDLADAISRLLHDDAARRELLANTTEHLATLRKSAAVPRYLDLIEAVARP
jgi:glycogen(starch) synthase